MYNQYGYNQQYYNPAIESQLNRLTQIQSSFPQYQQGYQQTPTQIQQTPQNTIKAVTSVEEVRAFTPSFDGSKTYFEDITTGNIYVKYLGINGLPVLDVYEKTKTPQTQETEYVSKKEFEEIKNKLNQYDSIFKELMGGNVNDKQSNAAITNA